MDRRKMQLVDAIVYASTIVACMFVIITSCFNAKRNATDEVMREYKVRDNIVALNDVFKAENTADKNLFLSQTWKSKPEVDLLSLIANSDTKEETKVEQKEQHKAEVGVEVRDEKDEAPELFAQTEKSNTFQELLEEKKIKDEKEEESEEKTEKESVTLQDLLDIPEESPEEENIFAESDSQEITEVIVPNDFIEDLGYKDEQKLLLSNAKDEEQEEDNVEIPALTATIPEQFVENVLNEEITTEVPTETCIDNQNNAEIKEISVCDDYQELDQVAVEYTSINDIQISLDMDLTVRTGLSKEDFVTLISELSFDKSGFFEENAEYIYDLCEEYSINEIFFCGLIADESGWEIAQNHRNTYNYISMMKNSGGLIQFESNEDGLEKAAIHLHENYLTEGGKFYHGKTIEDVRQCFNKSYPEWSGKVYACMLTILE